MPEPINTDNFIDSRDVIATIEEMTERRESLTEAWDQDDADYLAKLEALAEEAGGYAPDWIYGETLIRDSYFKNHAMDLAEEIGALPDDPQWPLGCIDWDQATRELQMDYTAVEFDGVTYWIR